MSDEASELEPLTLQPEPWGEVDLLEQIVDRYFTRKSTGDGILHSWQVVPLEGDPSEAVLSFERHIRRLGWTASIEEDDPYRLTLLQIPPGVHPSDSKAATYLTWVVSFVFSIILGALWISHQNSHLSWSAAESLKLSLIFFTTPLFAVLSFTSFLRKRLFQKMAVDVGHFLPVISPIIFFSKSVMLWPFGLLVLLTPRAMHALSWPNRISMVISGLFTPVSLMISGLFLTIAGVLMTGNNAPDFASMPGIIQLNPLTQTILSLVLTSEEIVVRSVWLHPTALAGQALLVFGWILLLPIPQFPGYRVLWGLVGGNWMSNQGNELALFFLYLIAIVVVLVTSGFTPWLFIGALAVWGVFSEESRIASGLIIDEVSGIDSRSGLKAGSAIFLALLLMAPGLEPVSGFEEWEAGVAFDWPDVREVTLDENTSFSLSLSLAGVHPRQVSLSAWLDPPRPDWGVGLTCGGEKKILPDSCEMGEVNLLYSRSVEVVLRINNGSGELLPSDLHLVVDEGDSRRMHTIRLLPEVEISPATPDWLVSPAFNGVVACLNLTGTNDLPSGNFSTSALLWQVSNPEGGVFNGESEPSVCLTGEPHAPLLLDSDEFGYILPLTFMTDDGVDISWPMRIGNPIAKLVIPESGWNMTGDNSTTPEWLRVGRVIEIDNGSETCLSRSVREPGAGDGDYVWHPETRPAISIPDVSDDEPMRFFPPLGRIIAACDDGGEINQKSANYTTVRGPSLALRHNGSVYWSWPEMPLESGVWEFENVGDESITLVALQQHGLDDTLLGWQEMNDRVIHPGESIEMNLTALHDEVEVVQVVWLSLDSEAGVDNSIRLNFGAWCRSGTDSDTSDGVIQCVEGA